MHAFKYIQLRNRPRASFVITAKIISFVAGVFCLVGLVTANASAHELRELTLEQKIGQLMIWSFSGQQMNPDLEQTLKRYQPGALIVFRANIQAPKSIARTLTLAQQNIAQKKAPPLFVMVDQEGGFVTRVKSPMPMPSALALAAIDNAEFTRKYALASANILFQLGFNVDLAPVLDISDPSEDSFIGNRTFGNDPARVTALTTAYAKGLSEAGLLPTAKHFPGHGGTKLDSHRTMPTKLSTRDELDARDLVPFTAFAGASFPRAVMMAHLSLPNVDPSGLPATYSPVIIGQILRKDLHYDGLVITDDLEMGGASLSGDIGERVVRAFLAGNDMLMVAGSSNHQHRAFEALLRAVKTGRITVERLDESVTRILREKEKLTPAPVFSEAKINAAFDALDGLSRQIMHHNFRHALEHLEHGLPVVTRHTKAIVFDANWRVFHDFQRNFRGHTQHFALTPSTLDNVASTLDSSDADFGVFFASGSTTAQWLNRLPIEVQAKLIVVNGNHPGEITHQANYRAVINLHSNFPESATWIARALTLATPKPDVREPASSRKITPN